MMFKDLPIVENKIIKSSKNWNLYYTDAPWAKLTGTPLIFLYAFSTTVYFSSRLYWVNYKENKDSPTMYFRESELHKAGDGWHIKPDGKSFEDILVKLPQDISQKLKIGIDELFELKG